MDSKEYDYVQHMNVLHGGLEKIDVNALVEQCTDKWYNQTLCRVNESVARLGILQGEYHWHQHTNEDEFFFVLDGRLYIDIDNAETIDLGPNEGVVVPKGVEHRPRAPQKVVVLMVETAAIDPKGNA